MTLTVGTGPFGHFPEGDFNFDLPRREGLLYFERFDRRMRAIFAGETVVDSRHPMLLHEHGRLPILYFPEAEVRTDLLEPSESRSQDPGKGEAWRWHIRVGDRVSEDAAWSYPEPVEGAPPLAGHFAFEWGKVDTWLQEDVENIGHVRDPYHRIDVLDTSRHVKVSLHGEVVAETTRARVLYETSLPPRWYIPREDVRTDLCEPSDLDTICAYKGHASYHSVHAGGELEENVVWHYKEPLHDAEPIRDYLAFFNERVDIEVDGELQERPMTQWHPDWGGRH